MFRCVLSVGMPAALSSFAMPTSARLCIATAVRLKETCTGIRRPRAVSSSCTSSIARAASFASRAEGETGTSTSTTAGLCGLFFLQRRCEAMSSRSEAEDWAEELEAVAGRIAPRFGRAEPRRRALAYLQGLLAPLERKNGWHLAEAAGDHTPNGMQEFLARVHWDA